MFNEIVDGAALRDMFLMGAALLEKNKSMVDALNVFPVPDGDTGTNMSMTMQGAVKELPNMPETTSVADVSACVSSGALRSARGNSGVILSQLFRGFTKALKGRETMDARLFAAALKEGTEAAYKAVMKPKEGTILTVSRNLAEAAEEALEKDPAIGCHTLMALLLEAGEESLKKTPELLPVLKEAGVVDSGGKGLMCIFQGFYMAMEGEDVSAAYVTAPEGPVEAVSLEAADLHDFNTDSIEFGYCTEFFIVHLYEGFKEEDLDSFRRHLEKAGDSVVVACDGDVVKVHVHSNCPGKILQMALRYGELDRLKIENMREQNRQLLLSRKKLEKPYGMVSVSTGEGIDKVFKTLGVDVIISGGQTMNPSIDTIVHGIRQANARTVYVLPNNSNIILAASQAVELCDCQVVVLPTKTIPQGIAAAMAFNADREPEENTRYMQNAFSDMISGSITYAVRETSFNGKEIHQGDIIGMVDGSLCVVEKSVEDSALALVERMMEKLGEEEASVTLYYGRDVEKNQAEALADKLEGLYPEADFILQEGGQPLYYYYFSVV